MFILFIFYPIYLFIYIRMMLYIQYVVILINSYVKVADWAQ